MREMALCLSVCDISVWRTGYRSIKESCCSYFSSNRLVFCRVIISLRLEGEDRVKQNQTNLSTGNYSAHRCPIINSYGPLGFFFQTMTQVHCVTAPVLKLLIYSTKSVDSLIDLEMLRLIPFCFGGFFYIHFEGGEIPRHISI